MSLTTPPRVQKLQVALHDKAKGSPNFRFYALYDKVYREDVLAYAYECCEANRGAAGVDGQRFEDIEEYGVRKWLDELAQELRSRTYQPQPVRRVWIPKPDGKQRPLAAFSHEEGDTHAMRVGRFDPSGPDGPEEKRVPPKCAVSRERDHPERIAILIFQDACNDLRETPE